MNTIYLSAERPRIPIGSEDEVRQAVAGDLLVENHYLELKRELPPGRAANRELARDLASFAVDGGTMLIGLDEHDDGTVTLAPQPLARLAERIEQVAATVPDPPLAVITRRVPSDADPSSGYLLAHVPASPAAPHMVEHRYLGRGDKTKRYLPDPEVLRLHERRAGTEAGIGTLLDAEIPRDPIPAESRRQAHLFLIAQPLAGRPGMLLSLTYGGGWQERLLRFVQSACTDQRLQQDLAVDKIGGFSPDLLEMSTFDRRPNGAAYSTYGLGPGRILRDDAYGQETVAEFEVHEDGALRIFMSRLSDHLSERGITDSPAQHVLFEVGLVTYVRRLIAMTAVAAETAGYFGNWGLAVGATGLAGCRSYALVDAGWRSGHEPPYAGDIYRRSTVVTYAELTHQPGRLADRLIGQILRALDTRQRFDATLADREPTA